MGHVIPFRGSVRNETALTLAPLRGNGLGREIYEFALSALAAVEAAHLPSPQVNKYSAEVMVLSWRNAKVELKLSLVGDGRISIWHYDRPSDTVVEYGCKVSRTRHDGLIAAIAELLS
jgi:hypothetical protein